MVKAVGIMWKGGRRVGARPPALGGLVLLLAVTLTGEVLGQATSDLARVGGRVLEHGSSRPLADAAVSLSMLAPDTSITWAQLSGSSGEFLFPSVRPGRYRLAAELLGYTELVDTLEVGPASETELILPLSVDPVPLDPVVVMVRQIPSGPLRGFDRRSRTMRGTFMTRADIEEANPHVFTDLLRTLPGVRLVPTRTYGYALYFRGGCVPDLWMDGVRIGSTVDIDSFLRPVDLEALEIYRGPELPGEFGNNLCGAIVAWTRRGDPSPERRSIVRQLILAAGFVVVIVLFRSF
jgi:hypothetical protein